MSGYLVVLGGVWTEVGRPLASDYVRWAEAAPSEDEDIDWLELNRQLSDGSF